MDGVEEVDPSSWTDEMKLFARNIQRRKTQTATPNTEDTQDQSTITNLNTIILRQVLQKPTKPQLKNRSIFNAAEAPQTTNHKPNQQDMRLPYFIDKDKQSITIPMPRGGFIRIRQITVEGKKKQPAATVVEQYKQNKKPPSNSDDDDGIPFIFDVLEIPVRLAKGLFSWVDDMNPFE